MLTNFIKNIKLIIRIIPYFTVRKMLNLLRLWLSYIFSVAGILKYNKEMPFFLSVEVTNYCNLHCPECPVGIKKYNIKEQSGFNFELFKSLIDDLKPTLQHVILYFQGEPTLNKQLPELIKYAHRAKIYTSSSTNGQFLSNENARLLVLSGLDKLIVSIDGSTQETYEKYRVGAKLNKAIEGIRHINFWKNELKSITPMVEIQFLVLKSNEHQLSEMRLLAKNLNADRLAFKTAQHYDFENGSELMTSLKKYSRYKKNSEGKFEIKSNQSNRCWRLWSGGVVNVRGEVLPCCFDKGSEHSFGNINQQSFSACWHNKKASDFREKILLNRKQFEMCRNCTE